MKPTISKTETVHVVPTNDLREHITDVSMLVQS